MMSDISNEIRRLYKHNDQAFSDLVSILFALLARIEELEEKLKEGKRDKN